MSNLNDLINLAKADGGKFFVIDEQGNAKLVIMGMEDYERLLIGKVQRQVQDVEKINQEILKAQLHEDASAAPVTPKYYPSVVRAPKVAQAEPLISKNDLRAEVIDPSFDFEGPKMEMDDL